jgi:rhamnose transport system substrate-binding protein
MKLATRRLLAIPLAAALLLGAGAPVNIGTSLPTNAASHRITFIPINTGNPYFDVIYSGVKAAAAKTGDTVNENAPSTASATGQIPFIQNAISQHVDGLMISASDPKAAVPAAKLAMAKGIKVITLNNDWDVKGRIASVLPTDFNAIGPKMVQLLAPQIHFTGEVAILTANPTAPAQTLFIAGMRQELKKAIYKNIKIVKVAFGYDDPAKSFTQAQNLLTSYPHLAGILAPTTVAVSSAAQVLETTHMAKKVALLGLGLPSQMRKYIKDGTTPQVLLWNPAAEGTVGIYLMDGLLNGTIKPHPGGTFSAGPYGTETFGKDNVVNASPPFVFDASNANKFNF